MVDHPSTDIPVRIYHSLQETLPLIVSHWKPVYFSVGSTLWSEASESHDPSRVYGRSIGWCNYLQQHLGSFWEEDFILHEHWISRKYNVFNLFCSNCQNQYDHRVSVNTWSTCPSTWRRMVDRSRPFYTRSVPPWARNSLFKSKLMTQFHALFRTRMSHTSCRWPT